MEEAVCVCVCMTGIECVCTLAQCYTRWALCVWRAIFYVFALHALSDTNRLLMCVGAVAETFHHLMIIVPSPVSTHPSQLFYLVFFPLWTISIYVSGHLSLFIHLLCLLHRPSLHLFSPRGDVCTVSFSKHIHPVTYRTAGMELLYMVFTAERRRLIFKDLDVLRRSHQSVSSMRLCCCT